jgi:hypothetical protein
VLFIVTDARRRTVAAVSPSIRRRCHVGFRDAAMSLRSIGSGSLTRIGYRVPVCIRCAVWIGLLSSPVGSPNFNETRRIGVAYNASSARHVFTVRPKDNTIQLEFCGHVAKLIVKGNLDHGRGAGSRIRE